MRSVIGRTALVAASLCVALVIGEAGVGMLAPQQLIAVDGPAIWRPDATFGWRHNENVIARVNTGEGTVRFATDGRGYRVDPDRHGVTAQVSVLALGDSFIEAPQVEASAAIPSVLGDLLSQGCAKSVDVANAGVSGWGPSQYRLEAQRATAREALALAIVFLYPDNDTILSADAPVGPAQIMLPAEPRWPARIAWSELVAAVLQPANDWLRSRSHLFLWAKLRLHPVLTRLGMTRVQLPEIYRVSERGSARWATTASVAKAIADDLERQRVPTMFVLIPAPYQADRQLMERYIETLGVPPGSVDPDQPTVLLRQALERLGLRTVDMLPPMRHLTSAGVTLYGSVDRHLNRAGHRVVAETVAPMAAEFLNCRMGS